MSTIVYLYFLLGLILVVKGGDWFVDSSVKMARLSGLPEIFIGATIVSVATTLPEVLVSATAATKNLTTMSVGNAVGSMICNIGLILGIVIICSPGKISGKMFKYKSLYLIILLLIFAIFAIDNIITLTESMILICCIILYLWKITSYMKNNNLREEAITTVNRREISKIGLNFVLGISAIILGSNLLIKNGVLIAEYIGIPEAVISLTLIALGTSLPELVTAITALKKGSTGISIGNIIGANIFNITMVIGISGIITPLNIIKQNLLLDIPVAILLTLLLVLPSLISKRVDRVQGIFILGIYILYIGFLFAKYINC